MNKYFIGLVAACTLAIVIFFSLKSNKDLSSNLPERQVFNSESEAYLNAIAKLSGHVDYNISITSGTPSMSPFIKEKAYIVYQTGGFDSLKNYDFICYKSLPGTYIRKNGILIDARKENLVFAHLIGSIDSNGIIPTGLNNKVYENWGRVTRDLFVGKIVYVAVWPKELYK